MDKLETAKWGERPILHQDHTHDLETDSAINEFAHKMDRSQAEEKAYKDYVTKHREAAAWHHLMGAKAADVVGDKDSAAKHKAMYDLHLQQLGHEPVGPVPESIAALKDKNLVRHRFRSHRGDTFAVLANDSDSNSEKAKQ